MTDISIEDFIKSKTNCELAVNEKVDLPIYYINLERSIGRKELFISQLKKYNIPLDQVTRINAIDGTSLEISTLTYKIYPREITKKKVVYEVHTTTDSLLDNIHKRKVFWNRRKIAKMEIIKFWIRNYFNNFNQL